ncbi:MAG: hypothetical protein LBU62_01930 [Bacteroidales bacterium]|nr:hypothetical protein [Bacteroidales bacterium]
MLQHTDRTIRTPKSRRDDTLPSFCAVPAGLGRRGDVVLCPVLSVD